MNMKNVAVLFGGRSVEHEISILTARDALQAIDATKYSPIPVYVDQAGSWFAGKKLIEIVRAEDFYDSFATSKHLLDEVVMLPIPKLGGLVRMPSESRSGGIVAHLLRSFDGGKLSVIPVDIFMPVFHGTYGEDGCVQGLFELADVAYTGCGVGPSSLGMNKYLCKQLLRSQGEPVVDGILLRASDLGKGADLWPGLPSTLRSGPLFVKPCNLGSSVGIDPELSIVETSEQLLAALIHVFKYDAEALIERQIVNPLELQVAVFRGNDIHASAVEAPQVCGKVNTASEKYGTSVLKKGRAGGKKDPRQVGLASAHRRIEPSEVEKHVLDEVRARGVRIYKPLGCSGVVRLDFLYDLKTKELFFNEVNTLPGSLGYYLFENATPPVIFTEMLSAILDSAEAAKVQRNILKRLYEF